MKERQVEQIQNNEFEGTRLKNLNVKGKSSLVLKKVIADLRLDINNVKLMLKDRRAKVAEQDLRIREQDDLIKKLTNQLERKERRLEELPTIKKEAYNKGKEIITEQRRESSKYYTNKILRLERKVINVQKPYVTKITKLESLVEKLRREHRRKNSVLFVNRKYQRELKVRWRLMSKEKNKWKALSNKKDKQLVNHKLKNKQLREKLYYKPKPRKQRIKTVYKQKPMTNEAKILNRISANKNVDKRFYNLYEVNLKMLKFCNDNPSIKDLTKLLLLLNVFSIETCFKRDIKIPNFALNMNFLTKEGLVDSGTNKTNNRYYFCTTKGTQLITDYKNYISYGDSPLKD